MENKKIAIYSRKSKVTEKGDSIKNQIQMCKNYVKGSGLEFDEDNIIVYEDEGYSGGNTNRPEFQKMMKAVRVHEIQVICCYRLDRIGRNVSDITSLVDELEFYEVSFVSVTERFDTATPTGTLMLNILSSFAQFERDSIAQRIADNKYELSKTGIWLGGMTPTGYRSISNEYFSSKGKKKRYFTLELIEEEATLVKNIFNLYLDLETLTKVETELLNQGIKSKNGKVFNRSTIKTILQNPVYMIADNDAFEYYSKLDPEITHKKQLFNNINGMMVYNKTKQQPGKAAKQKDESEWIVAVGDHKGLIPGKEWLRVKCLLNKNSQKGYRQSRSSTNPSLLSGIIRCRDCGAYMRPKLYRKIYPNGERSFSYLCETKDKSHKHECDMNNADGNKLDRLICEELTRISNDKNEFNEQLKRLKKHYMNDASHDDGISAIEKQLKNKNKELQNLLQVIKNSNSAISINILDAEIEHIASDIDELNTMKNQLEAKQAAFEMREADYETVKSSLKSIQFFISGMTKEELNRTLKSIINCVIWDGENAHVYLIGDSPNNNDAHPQCINTK